MDARICSWWCLMPSSHLETFCEQMDLPINPWSPAGQGQHSQTSTGLSATRNPPWSATTGKFGGVFVTEGTHLLAQKGTRFLIQMVALVVWVGGTAVALLRAAGTGKRIQDRLPEWYHRKTICSCICVCALSTFIFQS